MMRKAPDFIDVGVRNVRFWTFNVADMGITIVRCCCCWRWAAGVV